MSSGDCLKSCSIGNHLQESCHSLVYARSTGLKSVSFLTAEQVELVVLRTGISNSPDLEICLHHEQTILVRYSHLQKKCCNPFQKHKKAVKGSLREITFDTVNDFNKINISVIPGQKLCPTCRVECFGRLKVSDETEEHLSDEFKNESDIECLASDNHKEMTKHNLDTSLEDMELSPIKVHAVASHSKIGYGKRKLQQVQDKLTEQETTLRKCVAEVFDVTPEDLKPSKSDQSDNYKETRQKAEDLDILTGLMKEKIKVSNRRQKVQILTIAPSSWSIQKTKTEFDVSSYMVRQARKLKAEKGILEQPDLKKGKVLAEETKRLVIDFYCDDEYSRQMPGKKDFVSIGRNVHMQKKLLLCDLKELYATFKEKHPGIRIGFSKFCSLRPKWCVLVGSSGTHSVCVCTIHQNVSLMLGAVKLERDRHELMDMMVCNRDSKECMVHRCPNCPDTSAIENYLLQQLQQEDDEDDQEGEVEECDIQFQQWTTVDRSTLVSQILPVTDFVSLLVEKLNVLTAHSYITTAQAKYLKKCKNELKEDEVIVLGDFAENYKFIVQDEIQGFHWNKQSCTLHPVVLYYIKENKLTDKSISFISDDLTHDTCFVYQVMKETVTLIKEEICPTVREVHYFSDGCAGQYKNCKNFINLCLHERDFGVKCNWSFFATSHGKSPCDGLGGTLKRLTARASLQRPIASQILTAKQVFQYCKEEIQGIHVIFVTMEEMDSIRSELEERFNSVSTLPGTRSFHQFTPLSESVMAAKRVSEDEAYAIEFDLVMGMKSKGNIPDPKVSDFVVCSYDEKLWIAIVDAVDKEHEDVKVKFMHPNYTARSYNWPAKDDICYVPIVNVVCVIGAPVTVTGRQYKLGDKDINTIERELAS